jgi:soluble lytic murein transglycosylase
MAGEIADAVAMFRGAIEAAPLSSSALAAGRAMGGIATLSPENQGVVGGLFLRHGNFDRAITHLDRSLRGANAADTALVRLAIVRGLVNARRDAEAERRLPRLRTKTVPAGIADEATVLLARIRVRQGRVSEARELLASVDRPHPAAATGLYLLADLEHDRHRIPIASALYRRVLSEHPASDEAFEAAIRLGGLEFGAGRFAEAGGVYEAASARARDATSAQRALFWAGRSRVSAGDTARARAHFSAAWSADPTTFYGLRSGETLGLRLRTALGPSPATVVTNDVEPIGAGARIALLLELGLTDDAAVERERARRHFPAAGAGLYGVAETLHERGQTVEGVRLGREIRRSADAWNERLLRIVYPLPHGERIIRAARDRGLDPFLVAGLIRQESLFDTRARSVAGAVGLMQVMPRTGRELARRDGLTGFATTHLHDPDVNLRLGTLFFVNLLNQHGGAVAYALAAYNAGPSRVARWKQQPDMSDPDLFAERIPFAETRDYVRIVQQNARIYAEIYGERDDESPPVKR